MAGAPLHAAQLPVDPALLAPRHDSLVARVGGQPLGYQAVTLARTAEGLRYTEQTLVGAFVQQRTEILLTRAGEVRQVAQGGMLQGVAVRTSLEYRRGRVRGVTVVPTQEGPVALPADTTLPPGTIDDNAIALFLPALPWTANASWSFPVYVSGERAVRQMTLTVLGGASVALPSGPVATWQAELGGGQAPVRFYVTQAAPHRLVRIELVGSALEFVLVD